jgi:cell division protein FtsB
MTPVEQSVARAAGSRAGIASPRRPAPAPDRPRHLEVVQGRPAPGRRPPRPLILAVIGLVAGIVLVIVVARVLTGQAGFTEDDLQKRIADQRRQLEQLELSVAQLRSPQRIYERAVQLGLVAPDTVVFLTPSPAPAPNATAKGSAVARSDAKRPSSSSGRGGR